MSTPEEQAEQLRRAAEVGPDPTESEGPEAAPPASTAPTVDAEVLAEVVARSVAAVLEGQKEITQRAESLLRDQLIEERARRQEAEAKLASAEARLAELEADRTGAVETAWKTPRPEAEPPALTPKRRRWWQR
jgi:hypothetical protein